MEEKIARAVLVPKCRSTPFFKFLLAARGTDSNRSALLNVFCPDDGGETGVLVAADGRRIHWLFNVWSWGFVPQTQYAVAVEGSKIAFIPIEKPEVDYPNAMSIWARDSNAGVWRFSVKSRPEETPQQFTFKLGYELGIRGAPRLNGEFVKPLARLGVELGVSYKDENPDWVMVKGHMDEMDFAAEISVLRQ